MTMTVGDMIEVLSAMNPDAEVKAMAQPNWPFEHTIRGLVTREELTDDDADDLSETQETTDVFMVVGRQLCYGDKNAWDAV